MANDILHEWGTRAALTITLASLASSTTFVGRQSDLVDNTTVKAPAALVFVQVTTGTTPTANRNIYVRLLRYDNSAVADDGAGTSDAALTCLNAPLLGILQMNSGSSNVAFRATFDTAPLGVLGPKWGIQISHDTGVNLNSTAGNHVVAYIPYWPEVQ